jgi:uncharacterized membrane protein
MKTDKTSLSLFMVIIFATIAWITSCTHDADISAFPEICFDRDVLPIYTNNCSINNCHSGNGEEGSFSNYNEIYKSVVPYNPDASPSYAAIIAKWGQRMPPEKVLSQDSRTIIRLWIEQGAFPTSCPDQGNGGGNNTGTYTARACFSRDIMPVVVSKCGSTNCHDAVTHKEGLNYTTYSGIRSSVVAGSPGSSKLYRVITTSGGEEKMPPANSPQLTAAEIDSIGKWITYGALNETCGEVCDTINPVTFSGTIWQLIQSTCTGCHSGSAPSGNVLLTSYANVQSIASNGKLLNALNGTGVTRMPPSGPLSACRIRQFEIWINKGALNN